MIEFRNILIPALCAVGGILAGIVITKYTMPPRIEYKEKIVYQDREVIRWKDKEIRTEGPVRIVTRRIEVPGPQGPTVTVEKVVEREKVVTVTASEGSKDETQSLDSTKEKIIDNRPWFALSGTGGLGIPSGGIAWEGNATFRVAGLLWVGAGVIGADKIYIGPSVRLEF